MEDHRGKELETKQAVNATQKVSFSQMKCAPGEKPSIQLDWIMRGLSTFPPKIVGFSWFTLGRWPWLEIVAGSSFLPGKDGSYIKFDENAFVVISKNKVFLRGTAIFLKM